MSLYLLIVAAKRNFRNIGSCVKHWGIGFYNIIGLTFAKMSMNNHTILRIILRNFV
jgi:hypothetical protein